MPATGLLAEEHDYCSPPPYNCLSASTVKKDASLSHDGQRWVLYRPTAICWVLIVIAIGTAGAWAKDNYEIQVYGADTVAPQGQRYSTAISKPTWILAS